MGSAVRAFSRATTIALLAVTLAGSVAPARAAGTTASTFVFFEKFQGDNPRQWNVQTLSDGSSTSLAGGSYVVYRARPGTMRGWPLQVHVPAGFQFNVRLQMLKGSDPYEGVTFWDDLGNGFYLFALTPDGYAGLFRHTRKGYALLEDWTPISSIHHGLGAINAISVNLDRVSAANGRTFLINGVPIGKRCNNPWRHSLGTEPTVPPRGLFVGVVAGSYKGSTKVAVQRASMYDGTKSGPVPVCKARKS